jgi:hypothetical protein
VAFIRIARTHLGRATNILLWVTVVVRHPLGYPCFSFSMCILYCRLGKSSHVNEYVTSASSLTPAKLPETTQTEPRVLKKLLADMWKALEIDQIVMKEAIGKLRKHKTGAYRRAAEFLENEINRSTGRYARFVLTITFANILKTIQTNDAIDIYNSAVQATLKDFRSLKDRKMLIEAFAKMLNTPSQAVCLKCGKFYLRSTEERGYCSKKCWKGMLNRNEWLRRSGRSID